MKGRFNQVVGAISIALALLTPIVAELSSYAENNNCQVPGQLSNASPIIYVGPVYAGSHPGFLNPSGVNPNHIQQRSLQQRSERNDIGWSVYSQHEEFHEGRPQCRCQQGHKEGGKDWSGQLALKRTTNIALSVMRTSGLVMQCQTKMKLLIRTIDPKESTLIIIGLKDRMREP
jgi:hypothetical protein